MVCQACGLPMYRSARSVLRCSECKATRCRPARPACISRCASLRGSGNAKAFLRANQSIIIIKKSLHLASRTKKIIIAAVAGDSHDRDTAYVWPARSRHRHDSDSGMLANPFHPRKTKKKDQARSRLRVSGLLALTSKRRQPYCPSSHSACPLPVRATGVPLQAPFPFAFL